MNEKYNTQLADEGLQLRKAVAGSIESASGSIGCAIIIGAIIISLAIIIGSC